MKIILLKQMALAAVFFCSIALADDHVGTRHLQVVVNPQDPTFGYALNNGMAIVNNLFAPRPFGGIYLLSGLIYPGHTVSHKQVNFGVSKHGVVLNEANSIGIWWCFGQVLFPLAFTPMGFPAEGTIVERVDWSFWFKDDCHGRLNSVIASGGQVTAGVLQPNKPGFRIQAAITGATGCTTSANNEFKAKAYFGSSFETPQLLITIDFQNDVIYDATE